MERNSRIALSRPDAHRLRAILGARRGSLRDREHLNDLYDEMEHARIVEEEHVSADLVTMNSRVRVRDCATGVSADYIVVTPAQADLEAGRISVLAPLGTALLGYCEGDEVEWRMPGGVRRLLIEKVRQPERNALEHAEAAVV